MDENLYYRSINKDDTSPARRDQTHGLSTLGLPSPSTSTSSDSNESTSSASSKKKEKEKLKEKLKIQPPFLFRNAKGLLAMTKSHNVGFLVLLF